MPATGSTWAPSSLRVSLFKLVKVIYDYCNFLTSFYYKINHLKYNSSLTIVLNRDFENVLMKIINAADFLCLRNRFFYVITDLSGKQLGLNFSFATRFLNLYNSYSKGHGLLYCSVSCPCKVNN